MGQLSLLTCLSNISLNLTNLIILISVIPSLTSGTMAISSSHHSSWHISHWPTGFWTSLSNLSTLTDTPQGSLDSIPSQSLSVQRHCLWLMSQGLACRFRWLCICKLNINISFEISFNEAPRNFYKDLAAILLAPSGHQSGNQKPWQPETCCSQHSARW